MEQSDQSWIAAEARCTVRGEELSATHEIVAPTGDAKFGIISDLDDTVIATNMTSILTAAKLTFRGHRPAPRGRRPAVTVRRGAPAPEACENSHGELPYNLS